MLVEINIGNQLEVKHTHTKKPSADQSDWGAQSLDFFDVTYELNEEPNKHWIAGLDSWKHIIDPVAQSKPWFVTGVGTPNLSVKGNTVIIHGVTAETKDHLLERAKMMVKYTNGWYNNAHLPEIQRQEKAAEAEKQRIEDAKKKITGA